MLNSWKSLSWGEKFILGIAVATFIHSMNAYSMIFEGKLPLINYGDTPIGIAFTISHQITWYVLGILMAIAVDLSLVATAREVLKGNRAYVIPFIAAAVFSAYNQLVYAAANADVLVYSQAYIDFAAKYGDWILTLLDWKIIILPLSLPFTSVLYTISMSLTKHTEEQPQVKVTEYKTKQVADTLGINYNTVLKYIRSGEIGKENPSGRGYVLTDADVRKLKRLVKK